MRARRWRRVTWASVKLAGRLAWLAVRTGAELLVFPLLLPFYLLRRAHRREHEREE